jgi:hypothetical protein
LNNHIIWAGNIKDVIAMSIRENGGPLIDLTHDDRKAGPSSAVKEDPADPRDKQDVLTDNDYNFFQ